MLGRRRFLQMATVATPLALCSPRQLFAQDEKPDFDIAGTRTTDPAGYEIAWSNDWEETDIAHLTFENIPGQLEYLVLDWSNAPSGLDNQRVVITSEAADGVIDPQVLLDSFGDLYPGEEMGYAPGTRIETRKVTDDGCWFSFAGGENPFESGVVGISLFYTPKRAGDALLNVTLNINSGQNRTPKHLEMIDATISVNGNWLLGMDDLGEYWNAMEQSTESTL